MISVVMATCNDERRLIPSLSSLVPGVAQGLVRELIVADCGSTDETLAVVDAAGGDSFSCSGARGVGLRQAAARARAPWLLFMPAGPVLEEGWVREVSHFIDLSTRLDKRGPQAALFRYGLEGFGLKPALAEWRARARLSARMGPRPEQPLLIAASRYAALGGHAPTERPEAAFGRRLGARYVLLRARALNSED